MNTLNCKTELDFERINRYLRVATYGLMLLVLITLVTSPVYAAELNTGQSVGQWILDQIWYIALAIVAVMTVKFLLKKAWVPMTIFLVIGALCIYIIAAPESLKSIGQSIFGILFG